MVILMCKPGKRHRKGEPYPIIIELRHARHKQNLRRDVMAEMLGYHRMTVGRWERGESLPSFQALHDWCQVLGVNLMIRSPDRSNTPHGSNR